VDVAAVTPASDTQATLKGGFTKLAYRVCEQCAISHIVRSQAYGEADTPWDDLCRIPRSSFVTSRLAFGSETPKHLKLLQANHIFLCEENGWEFDERQPGCQGRLVVSMPAGGRALSAAIVS
jgi:hypothetical protein